jgi:hypothetical protein
MVARSNAFTLNLLSYRYVSKDNIQPVIIQGDIKHKIIEPGDFVYVNVKWLCHNDVFDREIMQVSNMDFSYKSGELNVSISVVFPEYYNNLGVRLRKKIFQKRTLSAV